MTNLELKKLEKRHRIEVIVLLILLVVSAILFFNTNIYISIIFLIIAAGVIYIEALNKKIAKELEKEQKE